MSRITITVSIDVPEGASIDISPLSQAPAGEISSPPAGATLTELPARTTSFAPAPQVEWTCPLHGTRKVIPAGVSKKTGKPYGSFVACGENNCDEKPPRSAA